MPAGPFSASTRDTSRKAKPKGSGRSKNSPFTLAATAGSARGSMKLDWTPRMANCTELTSGSICTLGSTWFRSCSWTMFCLARVSLLTTSTEAAVFCAVLVRFSAVTTTSFSWAPGAGCTSLGAFPVDGEAAEGPGGVAVDSAVCAATDPAQSAAPAQAAEVSRM